MNTRGLRPGDDRAVEAIFAATVALGNPLPFPCPDFDAYAELCLSWYLGPGRDDAVVLVEHEEVVGYALVCRDGDGHRRWSRRAGATWTLATTRAVLVGRYPEEAERFYRLRLKDGWHALLGPPPPCPAHLHVNVVAGHRGAAAGRLLVEAAEERLRAARVAQWYGEINAPVGRRGAALQRRGGRVVLRQPNHTLSWLAGRPVERLRVTRAVPAEARRQSQPLRRNARYSSPAASAIPASTNG